MSNNNNRLIKELFVLSSNRSYKVLDVVPGSSDIIVDIVSKEININGDPFTHYCGYDNKRRLLFSINALIPCEIIYEYSDGIIS